MKHAKILVVCGIILSIVGCGSSKGRLKGTVTVNGQKLPSGKVTIHMEDGKTIVATVNDGAYSAAVPPGKVTLTLGYAKPKPGSKPKEGALDRPDLESMDEEARREQEKLIEKEKEAEKIWKQLPECPKDLEDKAKVPDNWKDVEVKSGDTEFNLEVKTK